MSPVDGAAQHDGPVGHAGQVHHGEEGEEEPEAQEHLVLDDIEGQQAEGGDTSAATCQPSCPQDTGDLEGGEEEEKGRGAAGSGAAPVWEIVSGVAGAAWLQ